MNLKKINTSRHPDHFDLYYFIPISISLKSYKQTLGEQNDSTLCNTLREYNNL